VPLRRDVVAINASCVLADHMNKTRAALLL
jgi:hypothetical protein